ncbi:MAG: hypothetical protein M1383_02050 [Patescibacteria group bacterium]|nr:hypothetical protein [Patescibacteria group bacterium]
MSEPLSIYTENLFLSNKIKSKVKKLAGLYLRGPQAVEQNLFSGLKELGASFEVNRPLKEGIDTAFVLSGVKTLQWAINKQNLGLVRRIVAGPNIAVSPNSSGGILKDQAVDQIVVPSEWVREFYIKEAPTISSKIKVWAAGVALPDLKPEPKIFDFLIYNKIGKNPLAENICQYVNGKGYSSNVLTYGKFARQNYFQMLQQARYAIYLSDSESQGLALFEAWAFNVPVFAWDKGYFEYAGKRFPAKVGVPYLSEKTGIAFKDFPEFEKKLDSFLKAEFAPREWIKSNAGLKMAAEKFLNLQDA